MFLKSDLAYQNDWVIDVLCQYIFFLDGEQMEMAQFYVWMQYKGYITVQTVQLVQEYSTWRSLLAECWEIVCLQPAALQWRHFTASGYQKAFICALY